MSNKVWWEIVRWVNGDRYLTCNYVFAKDVTRNTNWSVSVDGVDLVFDEEIERVSKVAVYDTAILEHVFQKYIMFKKNDSATRKRIEKYLPGSECTREINTDEVIARNCIRFKSRMVIVEFNPQPCDEFKFRWVNPELN